MTYLVGITQSNTSAIISDIEVSWWRSNRKIRGENTALKSGLFFPGCIYGISGSFDDARNFIIDCKLHLTGRYALPDFWARFIDFVNSYRFPKDKDSFFEILLSSRNLGTLQFYVLDSHKSKIEPRNGLVTLGSGRELLDQYVQNLVSVNTEVINKLVSVEKRLPHFTFPYLYCLWLNELSQGMELTLLENYHVGGIFHFLWQDMQGEHAQFPAVYVLSAADAKKKTIYSWLYRVSYAQGALVVDNPITNAREIITDTAARPSFRFMSSTQLKMQIAQEIDAQPFYYFCGFGFADPKHRGEYGMAITNEGKFVVDKTGWMSPRFKALLQDKFSRDYKLVIVDTAPSIE